MQHVIASLQQTNLVLPDIHYTLTHNILMYKTYDMNNKALRKAIKIRSIRTSVYSVRKCKYTRYFLVSL